MSDSESNDEYPTYAEYREQLNAIDERIISLTEKLKKYKTERMDILESRYRCPCDALVIMTKKDSHEVSLRHVKYVINEKKKMKEKENQE